MIRVLQSPPARSRLGVSRRDVRHSACGSLCHGIDDQLISETTAVAAATTLSLVT